MDQQYLEFMPLPLRLLCLTDRAIVSHSGISSDVLKLVRAWYGIPNPLYEQAVKTPATTFSEKSGTGSEVEKSDVGSLESEIDQPKGSLAVSGSESDLEDQSKGGILGQIDKMSLGQLKMLKQRIEGKILIQENSSGND